MDLVDCSAVSRPLTILHGNADRRGGGVSASLLRGVPVCDIDRAGAAAALPAAELRAREPQPPEAWRRTGDAAGAAGAGARVCTERGGSPAPKTYLEVEPCVSNARLRPRRGPRSSTRRPEGGGGGGGGTTRHGGVHNHIYIYIYIYTHTYTYIYIYIHIYIYI